MHISETAFAKFLIQAPRVHAINHVIDCLKNGEPDNMAWELLETYHGNWRCKPEELGLFINKTIELLSKDVTKPKETDNAKDK